MRRRFSPPRPRQERALTKLLALLAAAILIGPPAALGQAQTVGLFQNSPGSSLGYTLFAPLNFTTTYLIDNTGQLVHVWSSRFLPGASVYLKENGHLLRTARSEQPSLFQVGGAAGLIEEFDWDGRLLWEFHYADANQRSHHDIEPLPNGNILVIAWEWKPATEAIAAGRNPALLDGFQLWPDKILEVQPLLPSGGNIVWEWHVWDHLVQDHDPAKANYGQVGQHPELIDLNFSPRQKTNPDWLHVNSVDYHDEFDQIMLSVPAFGEVWIIDHSTSTEEAAGHHGGRSGRGGDLLYRWGNPQAYRAGASLDQQFYWQHDARWIDPGLTGAGHLLIFNNGSGRPAGAWSSVEEYRLPVDGSGEYLRPADGFAFAPAEPIWNHTAEARTSLYSPVLSGATRLANGNTLICEGTSGTFLEVTEDHQVVWRYVNSVGPRGPINQGQRPSANDVFRAGRYSVDYPALRGRDLTPQGAVELDPNASFSITAVQSRASSVLVSWRSLPGSQYRIERTQTVAPVSWLPVGNHTAIGTLSHFEDANPFVEPHGYYRIVKEQ